MREGEDGRTTRAEIKRSPCAWTTSHTVRGPFGVRLRFAGGSNTLLMQSSSKKNDFMKKRRRNEKLFDFCKQFRFLRELLFDAPERNPAEAFYFYF